MRDPRFLVRRQSPAAGFAAATAVGVFLGLVGPFGSYLNGPRWLCLLYWICMSWLGFAVFGLGVRRLLRDLPPAAPRWTTAAVCALVLCVPFSLISWRLARLIWPHLALIPELTPTRWYLQCLIITVPQFLLFHRRPPPARREQAPASSAGLLGAPPSQVLCLQMEDHYVRVHTAGGSRLVLATMSQAIAALNGAPGLRVHRSWWVAERAVAGVAAEGRNLRLRLTNGVTAPVARTSVAAARAAGWLTSAEASAG